MLHATRQRKYPTRRLLSLAHPLVCLGFALLGQQLLLSGFAWAGGLVLIGSALLFASAVGTDRTATPAVRRTELLADDRPRRWRVSDAVALVALTAMAAAFRLWGLAQIPPGLAPDEARLGLAAAAAFAGDGTGSAWGA